LNLVKQRKTFQISDSEISKRCFKIEQKKLAEFAYVNHNTAGQLKGIQDFRERLTVGSWPAREGNAQYGSCLKIRHRLYTHTHARAHSLQQQ